MDDSKNQNDLQYKLSYVHESSESIEHYLRNSLPLKVLLQNEADGLGHLTITQLLDVLQDLHTSGQTKSYELLKDRKKPVSDGMDDFHFRRFKQGL